LKYFKKKSYINLINTDYSNDGSKAYLSISMNHDGGPTMLLYILDSSSGSVIGDSFYTNQTSASLLRNYEVDNYLYSVFA